VERGGTTVLVRRAVEEEGLTLVPLPLRSPPVPFFLGLKRSPACSLLLPRDAVLRIEALEAPPAERPETERAPEAPPTELANFTALPAPDLTACDPRQPPP